MTASYAAHLQRGWRFVVVQAAVAVVVVTAILAVRGGTSYGVTEHFVLHPAPSAALGDVNNSLGVLRQDGPLVQTVLQLLSSDDMLRRASDAAGVKDASGYMITATVAPGSNYFDATVTGPEKSVTADLARALPLAASSYVQSSYHGFDFDVVGDEDSTTHRSFPPSSAVVVLAFVLGAAAAAAELFVQVAAARLRRVSSTRRVASTPSGDASPRRVASTPSGDASPRRAASTPSGAAEDVAGVSRPFDAERDGFIMGEGAPSHAPSPSRVRAGRGKSPTNGKRLPDQGKVHPEKSQRGASQPGLTGDDNGATVPAGAGRTRPRRAVGDGKP